jgi:hypothetical protein
VAGFINWLLLPLLASIDFPPTKFLSAFIATCPFYFLEF